MKIIVSNHLVWLAVVFFSTQKVLAQSVYQLKKTTQSVAIDGVLNDDAWLTTEWVHLNNFYSTETIDARQKTTCKMLWDDEMIYVSYRSEDKYLTARETKRDGTPFLDDCGEIFIYPLPVADKMHFGFEVNLYKAANDFIFIYDYYPGSFASVKSYNPDYQVAVKWEGTLNDNSDIDTGWTMEMAIPIRLFYMVGPYAQVEPGVRWMFNLLKQDRNDITGERRISATLFPCEEPLGDVHSPSAFGLLEFVD
ncbi:carbohydrate-binding family 9-like protein [Reichenbachiella carrageenanivorans]|uniref:Carbohydrate-binding family 9-like protein n=1 Tax=Reichenbachiella carrageenanivorans TaxID=2979869 RepID=A0ABY6CW24_9BACT|nr:carbohydrate-binding family 9-like protein [Reichenbachiella carrageenanivorans]UXX78116.1 carbohydrate-binding family 9-like protein [Reichenbachiella carrageenanivorans]